MKVVFQDKTDEAADLIAGISEKNFTQFMDDMIGAAKEFSPIDTGNNRDSIKATSEWLTRNDFDFSLFTESGYGAWLELGTTRMPARPYFAPAFQFAHKQITATPPSKWQPASI